MKRILTAAALGLALFSAAPVITFAQQQTADAVMDGMEALGMKTEGLVLTEEQVLQVEAVLNGSDDESAKVAKINELLSK